MDREVRIMILFQQQRQQYRSEPAVLPRGFPSMRCPGHLDDLLRLGSVVVGRVGLTDGVVVAKLERGGTL